MLLFIADITSKHLSIPIKILIKILTLDQIFTSHQKINNKNKTTQGINL